MKAAYGKRVTDLFVEGTELVLADGEEPLVMWIQKLNPFEREEAMRSGQVARSRVMLALQAEGSDELALFRASAGELKDDELRQAIIDAKYAELLSEATNALRSDPDWAERLQILDRSDQLIDRPGDDPEAELLERYNHEYLEEVQRRQQALADAERDELQSLSLAKLRKRFEETWREGRGTTEFLTHYRLAELYYTARVCGAARNGDGRWSHVACDHRERVFEHRDEIKAAPGLLLDRLRATLDRLTMTPRDAKNSHREASSSASSPQPSTPEDSTASTPEETPPAPAGISPSPALTP